MKILGNEKRIHKNILFFHKNGAQKMKSGSTSDEENISKHSKDRIIGMLIKSDSISKEIMVKFW